MRLSFSRHSFILDFRPLLRYQVHRLVDDAFRERITDITKVRPGDKVVMKSGNEYTVKKTDSDRIGGQTLCLSIGELGFPDGWWVDDSFFQYAYRGPYTMDNLPKEPGFYKARTESVWKHDGKRWMPVLSHDGTIAPAFPCQSQSRSQFFKTSVRMIVSRSRRWRRASSDFHPEAGLQVRQMPVGSRGQDHAPPMPHMRCR